MILLVRHLARLVGQLLRFGWRGGGRATALLVLVGGPIVLLVGALKLAGLVSLYPFL